MKKYHYVLILMSFLSFIEMDAEPTITFFFRPSSDLERMMLKLKKPGSLAKATLHGMVDQPLIAGILVLYAGYITASDYNGEVILPRKHLRPAVTIMVAPEFFPVTLFDNTIHHWELVPGVPAAMYSYELKYNDNTEEHYWDAKEISVPTDRKIPLESIVIVAKPKNVIIPSGIKATRETANFVLPPVYITKGINIVAHSMYMLTVRHLFKPVDLKNKREPLQILTHVTD